MHSLNLKITYNCVNNCQFCFSSYLKNESISNKNILRAIDRGYQNGCRALVISGGEPTLYQSKVIKYFNYAYKLGFKSYTIQTNGYGLSTYERLYYFLKEFSVNNDVAISFSIHGSNKDIHNKITLNIDSFNKLIASIENISYNTKCKLFSNSVVTSINVTDLFNIYNLLNKYNFNIIQFAVMHTLDSLEYSIGLLKSSLYIRNLLNKLQDTSKLRTEGIPYCLLYGFEECVGESYWPEKLDIFNSSNDYIDEFNQLNFGMRKKAKFCNDCIMCEVCAGVWTEHISELYNNCRPIN